MRGGRLLRLQAQKHPHRPPVKSTPCLQAPRLSPAPTLHAAWGSAPPGWLLPLYRMSQAPFAARLHSAALPRFLAERGLLDAPASPEPVAQRLGQWLGVRHAASLHALLDRLAKPEAARARTQPVADAATVQAHVQRTQAALQAAIAEGRAVAGAPRTARHLSALALPADTPAKASDMATAWEPYRRYLAAHQKQMHTTVQALHQQVRATLAHAGPDLHRLALLDAAYAPTLEERQSAVLAGWPVKMEWRFAQSAHAHREHSAPAKPAWLRDFETELQTALLAELDLRLQPVHGLVAAYLESAP